MQMNPTKGIKPSEAMVDRASEAIRNTPEAGGEYVENHMATPPLPGEMADAFARAALASIPDPLAVIEALTQAANLLEDRLPAFDQFSAQYGYTESVALAKARQVSGKALAVAEQFKKDWCGEL